MEKNFRKYQSPEEISGDFFLQLSKLDQSFFPNPWSIEAFKSFLNSNDFLLLSVEENGTPIGFALFYIQYPDSFAHLLKIVIANNQRGGHLGKELLKRSIEILTSLNIRNYFLEVEESNMIAINLYNSFGFKQVHLNKNFYGTGRHALIMTMNLE